ncbi:M14 family zinc carboxypeptidase [Pirellulales bacterium]|nr:M14 family zinc carboxypeptidase [Pirellulales bacterium]
MPTRDLYTSHRISPEVTSQIRHGDVVRLLGELQQVRPDAMQLSELGCSFEGRSISLVTLGSGPTKVFAWSQMHGNEPTHTAVLLDLISFIQRSPDHPAARSMLAKCTLYLVVMLNPDGAERYTRRNAQGIDINRDALQLQSPEGRILKQTIDAIQPDFALNLHNQSPRACVGEHPARVAAVSLLVPPVDADDSETGEVRAAKQLAGCFVNATKSVCVDMISRYNAGFMPRCFGEWVQGQKIPTLTIEAGGWTGHSIERSPLVPVHFQGLLGILQSIASSTYQEVDPAIYDALQVNNQHRLLDVIIRDVRIEHAGPRPAARGDIGIDFESISADHRLPLGGVVADLGSLSETTGKIEIAASSLACLPGRIVFSPEVTPLALPSADSLAALLTRGATAVVGIVNVADAESLEALARLRSPLPTPLHVGFLGDLSATAGMSLLQVQERLVRGISLGMLGAAAASLPPEVDEFLEWFGLASVADEARSTAIDAPLSTDACLAETSARARQLKIRRPDQVAMEASADLLFLEDVNQPVNQPIDWNNLRQVMVAGNVVWKDGNLQIDHGGSLLTAAHVRRSH